MEWIQFDLDVVAGGKSSVKNYVEYIITVCYNYVGCKNWFQFWTKFCLFLFYSLKKNSKTKSTSYKANIWNVFLLLFF